MSTFKAKGIVLKEIMVGESNKILILLLKEYGKVLVSARGARKTKSKFLAGTELFTYSDFVIYKGESFNSITQIDVIESFFELRTDYSNMCYGTYFLELTEKVIMENLSCDEILLLLLKTLKVLTKNIIDVKLIARVFEIKFLQLNGYSPEVSVCSHCRNEIPSEYFFGVFGVICKNCLSEEDKYIKVSQATIYTVNYILTTEISQIYNFTVSDNVLWELTRAVNIFFNAHLEINLKSTQFL